LDAVVKWFDPSRNFGFVVLSREEETDVVRNEGSDVFFHADRCDIADPLGSLARGVRVLVDLEWSANRACYSVSNLVIHPDGNKRGADGAKDSPAINRHLELSSMSREARELEHHHTALEGGRSLAEFREAVRKVLDVGDKYYFDSRLIRGRVWQATYKLVKLLRTPAGSGEILDDLAEVIFQLKGRHWSFSPRQRQILKQSAALARDIRNSRNARDARYAPVKTPSPIAFSKEKAIRVAKERTSRLVLVLEGVNDLANRYGIYRTADALGIHEIWIVRPQEKILKSPAAEITELSQGCEHTLRIVDFVNTTECLKYAKEHGREVWVTSLRSDAVALGESLREEVPKSLAIVMGSEASGISDEMNSAASKAVYLPTSGFVESLNVHVATALVLNELFAIMGPEGRGTFSEEHQSHLLKKWREDGVLGHE